MTDAPSSGAATPGRKVAKAAGKTDGKNDGKKRFEVKKVNTYPHRGDSDVRLLNLCVSGMPSHFGLGIS
jgi:hypothetical protein